MSAAKRKRKTHVRALSSDFGPSETRQHGEIIIDRVAGDGSTDVRDRARRNMTQPLEYYKGRKIITETQYWAGSTLRKLYDEAHVGGSITPKYAEQIGGGSVEMAHDYQRKVLAAYNNALWYVGPIYTPAVHLACIAENYLGSKAACKRLALGLTNMNMWLERGSPRRRRVDMPVSDR